jgi:hypothetical protein
MAFRRPGRSGRATKMIAPVFQEAEKKEQGRSPARKIVSTLFTRMLDFILDCRVDAA